MPGFLGILADDFESGDVSQVVGDFESELSILSGRTGWSDEKWIALGFDEAFRAFCSEETRIYIDNILTDPPDGAKVWDDTDIAH